jgi:predicted hotdog family 3-hydroxylacyl-ACP dehydratase
MKSIPLADLTLEDLLPHRGAMLLVEEVLEIDSVRAVTLCRAKKSWPMADDRGVHPLILVELAAQTAGVCNGWDRIQTKGLDSEKMGWLVGVKAAEFFTDSLPFGGCVRSCAENTYNFANLREVSCEQTMDDKIIANITLQLFQA